MKISNGLLITKTQTIPLDHISSFKVVERELDQEDRKLKNEDDGVKLKRHWKRIWLIYWPLVSGISGFFFNDDIYVRFGEWLAYSAAWAIPMAIVCGVVGKILEPKLPRYEMEYAVSISTTSGGSSLFWSLDRDFVLSVHNAFTDALMSDVRKNINLNVNIEKQEITDNSVNYDNRSTTIINDYSIDYSNYEGLAPDQLEFLTNSFQGALEKLAEDIRSNSNAANEKFQELLAALKAPEPDKGRIQRVWEHIKSAHEAGEISTSSFGIVMAGLSILGIA